MVKTIQIILDPAKIVASFANPLIALPPPPSGFVNNILSIAHDMMFATTGYTGATKLQYQSQSEVKIFEDDVIINSVVSSQTPCLKVQDKQLPFSTTKAFYVTTDALAADGDSTINGYISYEQIQIGA